MGAKKFSRFEEDLSKTENSFLKKIPAQKGKFSFEKKNKNVTLVTQKVSFPAKKKFISNFFSHILPVLQIYTISLTFNRIFRQIFDVDQNLNTWTLWKISPGIFKEKKLGR